MQHNIVYADNSCTQNLKNTGKSHFHAIKQIGQYLLGTQDRGIILHPTNENCLSTYVNGDFSGSWSKEIPHLWHSVLQNTPYLLTCCKESNVFVLVDN